MTGHTGPMGCTPPGAQETVPAWGPAPTPDQCTQTPNQWCDTKTSRSAFLGVLFPSVGLFICKMRS